MNKMNHRKHVDSKRGKKYQHIKVDNRDGQTSRPLSTNHYYSKTDKKYVHDRYDTERYLSMSSWTESTQYVRKLKLESRQQKSIVRSAPVGGRKLTHSMSSISSNATESDISETRYGSAKRRRNKVSYSNVTDKTELDPEADNERKKQLLHKFRVILWTTVAMCRVCKNMTKESKDQSSQKGATEFYLLSANEGRTGDDNTVSSALAFDKHIYSRNKAVRLPLNVRTIANKDPLVRSDEELDILLRAMNSMRSFKERTNDEMKRRICQYAIYASCEEGRVVLRQGHKGHYFYYIYSGSVFVQLEHVDPLTKKRKTSVENIIGRGASFGELALLSQDGRRTATIICREPTELFQIERTPFMRLFPNLFQKELQMKTKVSHDIPLFDLLSEEQIKSLCFQAQNLVFSYGKVIEHDLSKASHIFYVTKGKIMLLSELKLESSTNLSSDNEKENKASLPDQYNENKEIKAKNCCNYLSVGYVLPGEYTDLRILSRRTDITEQISPVILVSLGVEVVRFSKRVIDYLLPGSAIDVFLKEQYDAPTYPSLTKLRQEYVDNINWNIYKKNVIETLYEEARGAPIALRRASDKGGCSPKVNKHSNAKFDVIHINHKHQHINASGISFPITKL